MKKVSALLTLCISGLAMASGLDDLHAPWGKVLTKIVQGDRVDYAAARAEMPAIEAYLKSLSAIDPAAFSAASPAERNAVWLNAFNAGVVQLVATNMNVPSIADVPHWRDSARFDVAGRQVSLGYIQDSALLLDTKDARYWFSMTDGTLMAAPLTAMAFTSANLDERLTENTRAFLAAPARVKTDARAIHLQKNFDWLRFKPYFKKAKGGVDFADFLGKYGLSADWSKLTPVFDIPENYAKNGYVAPVKVKKGKKR